MLVNCTVFSSLLLWPFVVLRPQSNLRLIPDTGTFGLLDIVLTPFFFSHPFSVLHSKGTGYLPLLTHARESQWSKKISHKLICLWRCWFWTACCTGTKRPGSWLCLKEGPWTSQTRSFRSLQLLLGIAHCLIIQTRAVSVHPNLSLCSELFVPLCCYCSNLYSGRLD